MITSNFGNFERACEVLLDWLGVDADEFLSDLLALCLWKVWDSIIMDSLFPEVHLLKAQLLRYHDRYVIVKSQIGGGRGVCPAELRDSQSWR